MDSPILGSDEIHVWPIDLVSAMHAQPALLELLNAEEIARADRFLVAHARNQFIAARAGLRKLLGVYLRRAPESIVFELSPLGKPTLADKAGGLYFNLSHSHDIGLVAITTIGPVGVDVEFVRSMASIQEMAKRFFHPSEVATLARLPVQHYLPSFFHAWTRKEAFLKATGKGIGYGIERVAVTLAPGAPARVLSIDGDEMSAQRWFLESLQPSAGYVGAVALERPAGLPQPHVVVQETPLSLVDT